MLERVGGVSGLVLAGVPTFAYVIVNAIAGLDAAVVVAVAVSAGLIVFRLVRKQPLQPAVSGLLGVVIAALIAYYTGSAENYFLPGIWISLAMAAAFMVSVLVRRPLVGVIWNLLRSSGPDPQWREDRTVLRGFDIATLAFVVLFAARYVVQQWLYDGGHTGWLAVTRIGMGYPLLGVALLVVFWAVRRANRRTVAAAGEREAAPPTTPADAAMRPEHVEGASPADAVKER